MKFFTLQLRLAHISGQPSASCIPLKFSGTFGHESKTSAIPSPSESLLFCRLVHQLLFQLFKSLTILSQASQKPLLFTSSCDVLLLIGQLSKLQVFLWERNIFLFILSAVIEQSVFSFLIIQIKFFIQSQSMSSSQISGIQSLSISQENFQRVLFHIDSRHISLSAIAIVDVVSKSMHSLMYIENFGFAIDGFS